MLDGETLLINTLVSYRKYQNLVENPFVACVITTNHEKTLQFEGTALELRDGEADDTRSKMLDAEPDFANFFDDTDTRFFRLTPAWMRLRDYAETPMKTIEFLPKTT